MNERIAGFLIPALAALAFACAHAQVAVVPTANHERMLASPDARLGANKRLVYDFYSTKKYTTTWFDMFRIQGGKIAEHWDPASKRQ